MVEDSILHLYRRLLAGRRRSPALHAGAWELLDAPAGVLAYERVAEADRRQVWANFGAEEAVCAASEAWVVDVATRVSSEGRRWDGRLAGTEAVVLRRDG